MIPRISLELNVIENQNLNFLETINNSTNTQWVIFYIEYSHNFAIIETLV